MSQTRARNALRPQLRVGQIQQATQLVGLQTANRQLSLDRPCGNGPRVLKLPLAPLPRNSPADPVPNERLGQVCALCIAEQPRPEIVILARLISCVVVEF